MSLLSDQPIFTIRSPLGDIQKLGHTPYGERRIINILGGTVEGPKLNGKILPGGADWQIVRADGTADLDARYTLETSDGALIYVHNRGYRHGPREVIARLVKGEDVDPALYYMRTTPWFETSAPAYDWLNRIVCVGTGARRPAGVELELFEVK